MSFGWSAGDVLQAAQIAWDVYKCIADGAQNAKVDFTQFKAEFELMRATIEELQEAEKDVPASKRIALGQSYQQTITDCTEFVKKHERLASDIHPGGPKEALQWHKVSGKVKTVFHQVSWPIERKEAERLRRALERNVQLANLMATNTVIDITKQARQENLEILRAIKIMSLQISFILRQCMPGHTSNSGDNTLESRLLSELGQRALPRLRDTEQLPSLLDILPSARSDKRESKPLLRIQNVSQKLDHLIMRRDMPVVGFLDQIRADIRGALNQAGFKHVTVPGQLALNAPTKPKEPARILNKEIDEWEKFSDWVKFQLLHQERAITPARREDSPRENDPPAEPPPTPPLTEPISTRYRCTRVETQSPVLIQFPDPNQKNHELHKAVKCTISVYLHHRTRELGLIEATDLSGTVKITHRIHESTFRGVQSSMIPYVESAHVVHDPTCPFRICFQGSHRVKIESNGVVERYAISPVYICRKQADFVTFQSILLGRNMLYCGDVKYINADGVEEHCSLETIRILQDPLTSARSLLYFGKLKQGSSAKMGFLEWPLDGFIELKSSKLSTRLQLQGEAITRRNSMGSIASVMSNDSRHSNLSMSSSGRHIRQLEIVFYDERDCEAFRNSLRS
ncbi:uncharacterized protein CDV56_105824 [Aspergillus thermomutatus]|uniref:Uncharacterized protein n=1 Tax=Aspergillus thermomutatus TaxID=41047 RepID=A0A397GMI1_ASPTH|nr:uncharacterized protein CDV56_105824 [Aspergillus thermomutatus]RHZ49190.1 hypothetical protein CDV56_105824 [Aspergillus thermomutatus]